MLSSKNPDPMNVIIYTRVSSEEQIQNYSLDTQEKACLEFCEKQKWKVIKIFREEGESAKTASRTELTNLLKFCHDNKGQVNVVLVTKFDRFARDMAVHHSVKALLAKYGISVKSVNENTDDTPAGKFMENIFAAAAQWDNDVRSERSKNGLKEKVLQGEWAWAAPIGYLNSPGGIIVDPYKAPLVQRMFELYSQGGETIKGLTVKANKWGLRNKHGQKLYAQNVTRILQNKFYIGTLVVERWNYEGGGNHKPLITKEIFYKVDAVRNRKVLVTAPRLIKNPDFPLKSLAHCNNCDRYLTGSYSKGRGNRYPYYHCTRCKKVGIGKSKLEYAFFNALKDIQPNPGVRKLFEEVLIDVNKQKLADKLDSLTRIDKSIQSLKERKSLLLTKNINNVVSDSDYKEAVKEIDEQVTIEEIERSELRQQETKIDHLLALADNVLSNVALLWFEAPFEHKLRFQSLVFPEGFYFDGERIGTATLGLPFSLIQEETVSKIHLVPRTGLEPVIAGMKTQSPNH